MKYSYILKEKDIEIRTFKYLSLENTLEKHSLQIPFNTYKTFAFIEDISLVHLLIECKRIQQFKSH